MGDISTATRQVRKEDCNRDAAGYLVYPCTQDEVALFVPLQSEDGTFVLAQRAGQVPCGEAAREQSPGSWRGQGARHQGHRRSAAGDNGGKVSKVLTVFGPYPGEAVVGAGRQQGALALSSRQTSV